MHKAPLPRDEETHWSILASTRFFLASVVALGHFALFIHPDFMHLFGGGYLNPLSAVFGFFVLSGYSIAASMDRSAKGFFRRRAIRIWPLYLSAIAYGLLVLLYLPKHFAWPMGGGEPIAPITFVFALFMLQNMFWVPSPPIIGVIWSLSVEWWLYVCAPIFRRLSSAALGALVLASFGFYLHAHGYDPSMQAVAGWSDAISGRAFFGLAWIWIIGFIYYRIRFTSWGYVLLIAPPLVAASLGRSPGIPYFITAFVLMVSHEISLSARLSRVLNLLGDISYPLYLIQMPTLALLVVAGVHHRWLVYPILVLVATAFLYGVDYPARAFFKRRPMERMLATLFPPKALTPEGD